MHVHPPLHTPRATLGTMHSPARTPTQRHTTMEADTEVLVWRDGRTQVRKAAMKRQEHDRSEKWRHANIETTSIHLQTHLARVPQSERIQMNAISRENHPVVNVGILRQFPQQRAVSRKLCTWLHVLTDLHISNVDPLSMGCVVELRISVHQSFAATKAFLPALYC